MTMAVIAALHVPLIVFAPWGNRWLPAILITPLAVVDLVMIVWMFLLLAPPWERRSRNSGKSLSPDVVAQAKSDPRHIGAAWPRDRIWA
jgi:hypothetical protein